jgi:hypothetical protein
LYPQRLHHALIQSSCRFFSYADILDHHAAPAQSDGPGSPNYGSHDTNAANKLDSRYNSDLDYRGTTHDSTNYGPHHTNVAYKLDPRVDSNLDHRGTTEDSTNYGPHHTNIANKLDPRVDSDRDHRVHHVHREYPDGTQSTGYGGHESTNYGPHHTNAANKLDPTVDSDRDYRASQGSTNYGPHSTNIANKLDPHYDSDLDHRGPGGTNSKLTSCVEGLWKGVDETVRRTSHEDLSRTDIFSAPVRAGTMPDLHHDCPASDPEGEELNSNGRYSGRESKAQHAPRKFPIPPSVYSDTLRGHHGGHLC